LGNGGAEGIEAGPSNQLARMLQQVPADDCRMVGFNVKLVRVAPVLPPMDDTILIRVNTCLITQVVPDTGKVGEEVPQRRPVPYLPRPFRFLQPVQRRPDFLVVMAHASHIERERSEESRLGI